MQGLWALHPGGLPHRQLPPKVHLSPTRQESPAVEHGRYQDWDKGICSGTSLGRRGRWDGLGGPRGGWVTHRTSGFGFSLIQNSKRNPNSALWWFQVVTLLFPLNPQLEPRISGAQTVVLSPLLWFSHRDEEPQGTIHDFLLFFDLWVLPAPPIPIRQERFTSNIAETSGHESPNVPQDWGTIWPHSVPWCL